jgi:hypothetical protein
MVPSYPATGAAARADSCERGGRGGDDAYHVQRIPILDSCSIRSGVSVAALLR